MRLPFDADASATSSATRRAGNATKTMMPLHEWKEGERGELRLVLTSPGADPGGRGAGDEGNGCLLLVRWGAGGRAGKGTSGG